MLAQVSSLVVKRSKTLVKLNALLVALLTHPCTVTRAQPFKFSSQCGTHECVCNFLSGQRHLRYYVSHLIGPYLLKIFYRIDYSSSRSRTACVFKSAAPLRGVYLLFYCLCCLCWQDSVSLHFSDCSNVRCRQNYIYSSTAKATFVLPSFFPGVLFRVVPLRNFRSIFHLLST